MPAPSYQFARYSLFVKQKVSVTLLKASLISSILMLGSFFVYAQDTMPPFVRLADINVSTTENSAEIAFVTQEPATSEIEWDVDEQFRNKVTASNVLSLSHRGLILVLIPDTRYFYRIKTRDDAGNLATSISLSFVTKTKSISPVEALPRISNIQILARAENMFRVSWDTAKDSVHWVSYGKDNKNLDKTTSKTSAYATTHVEELTGLDSGATYYYQINVQDQSGKTVQSSIVAFDTLKPKSEISSSQITDLERQIKDLQTQIVAFQAKKDVSSSPKTETAFRHTFTKVLYSGLRNDSEVRALQEALSILGFYTGSKTGNFYALTLTAVKKFQQSYGISVIGRVGPQTRAKLNEIFSK